MVLKIFNTREEKEYFEQVIDPNWIFNNTSSLTNFEIQKCYQNEPRFKEVYSRNNLPKKIKDGACVINLDGYSDIGTQWIALYALNTSLAYF